MHKGTLSKIGVFLLSCALVVTFYSPLRQASAAGLYSSSVALSSEAINDTSVTYTLTFSGVSLSEIKCINVRLTDTLGSDSKPTGLDITSATLGGTSSYIPTPASWTTTPNNTSGNIAITYSTGETPASDANRNIKLSGITNGSVKNTTYYAEVTTFDNTDCSSSAVDNGNAAFVYTDGVLVSGNVDPSLAFSLTATSCSLGVLSASAASTCSHTMTAATNAAAGYSISYDPGNTLTSGSDTIDAIGSTAAAYSTGVPQFGLNLVNNSSPDVGADPNLGHGAAVGQYGIANSFAFDTGGGIVASSSELSSTTTFTVSYMASISTSTPGGVYQTTMVYNITANF